MSPKAEVFLMDMSGDGSLQHGLKKKQVNEELRDMGNGGGFMAMLRVYF